MSTTPGLASKGEKSKQKYQSLDINHIYISNKSESLETQQQKSFPRKHGMQLLGKVPAARKPAFLPSIKSELSGSNASVLIVPSGGSGWGKQDIPSIPATSLITTSTVSSTVSITTVPSHISVTSSAVAKHPVGPVSFGAPLVAVDKSWSSVMTGNDFMGQPPPYQSLQFQHEFPSLAGSEGALPAQQRGPPDAQYGPGPSLRPQTEGSWIQGGVRMAEPPPVPGKVNLAPLAGPPQLLGPAGHVPQPPQSHQHMTPQLKAMLPPFMCRGNFSMNGPANSNFSSKTDPLSECSRFPGHGPQFPEGKSGALARPESLSETEDLMHRPIIKEEDLNRMDDMTRDIGWASHDDIDYNQKLAFSDDESSIEQDKSKDMQKKEPQKLERQQQQQQQQHHHQQQQQQYLQQQQQQYLQQQQQQSISEHQHRDNNAPLPSQQNRAWSSGRVTLHPAMPQQGRGQAAPWGMGDEEFWAQRRKQQQQEVAIATARAKQRKEEEEKRFIESRQNATKKLMELEERLKEKKGAENKENEENQGTFYSSTILAQTLTTASITVPDWEKDRERSRTPNETVDGKAHAQPLNRETSEFRQLTQIEGRNFINKNSRGSEREISRDRDGREQRGGSSRHFQTNMPPRFLKQQAEMQNAGNAGYRHGGSGSSNSPQPQQVNMLNSNMPFAQQCDLRWINNSFSNKSPVNNSLICKPHPESMENFDRDREDECGSAREIRHDRYTPDEIAHYSASGRKHTYNNTNRKISKGRYFDEHHGYRENSQEYIYKRERDEKWEKERDRQYDDRKDNNTKPVQQDPFDEHEMKQDSGGWGENYGKDGRDERPQERSHHEESQRSSNRDSRLIKDLDYTGNWTNSPYESAFNEDKKKDSYREERRQVPEPITKEKIEADDLRSEKRQLTQLKPFNATQDRDEKPDNKADDLWALRKKESGSDRNENTNSLMAWADVPAPPTSVNSKLMEVLEKTNKKSASGDSLNKLDSKSDPNKEDRDLRDTSKEKVDKHIQGSSQRSRGERDTARNHRSWNSAYSAYPYSWSKRNESRGSRSPQRSGHLPHSARGGDWHLSDSELSGDEVTVSTKSGKEDKTMQQSQFQRSPKSIKKSEKDEKNKDYKQDKSVVDHKFDKRYEGSSGRESFILRGEPSRHGRGGFRGTKAVVSKRSDGYGIPPSKSPFGNAQDDKDKKLSGDENGGEMMNSEDKGKLGQMAWLSGPGGARSQSKHDQGSRMIRKDEKRDGGKGYTPSSSHRQKSKSIKIPSLDAGEECWETTSDNSDIENECKDKNRRKAAAKGGPGSFSQRGSGRQGSNSGNQHGRMREQGTRNSDKRLGSGSFDRSDPHGMRQNSMGGMRSGLGANHKSRDDSKDLNLDKKDSKVDCTDSGDNSNLDNQLEEKNVPDADGFQEVRSKKNVKERQKMEKVSSLHTNSKSDKEPSRGQKSKGNSLAMQIIQQQIAAIPPLLGTPMNPSNTNSGNNKMSFERMRQMKLPPRFARLHMQQQGMCDMKDKNKLNQSISVYMKDGATGAAVPVVNAWDKSITSQLHNSPEQDMLLGVAVDGNCADVEQAQQPSTSSQRSSSSNDKGFTKVGLNSTQDKAALDGTTPLVNTIIFENTNYKSAPVASNNDLSVKSKFTHLKTQPRTEKTRGNKMEDADMDTVKLNFNKPMSEMLNKGDSKPEPIHMPLTFNKAEDNADMKLDFTFDSELSQLTEDKSSKSLGLPHSIHTINSAQSANLPSTADLDLKIASVKKVWDNNQEDNMTSSSASFSASFGPDPNTLDHAAAFSKGTDTPDDNHDDYNSSPNQSCTSNNTTNVCKVKPTQQLAGSGQAVHPVSSHHTVSQQHAAGQHSAMVSSQNLMGHPLSPPPMQQVLGAGVGLGQPPQQYTSNQHINYQPSLGGSAQYGSMSAIPSPPTVLFNSTQQLPTQGGLYGPFQIDQSQVLNTQGRSQFSQYPNPYGLGQTASSPYNTQSMYLQTAPPHPPPSAQPPPDLYQSLPSQYRMAATGPFAQSQQLTNNPSTVLIPSTSNSLMSATVKPSSQQISAIGTKAGTVGQAYQQQSQQGQQLYIPFDPNLQANYLSSTGVLQRGHTGPVQNSVVPGLQPSSSYYSGSGIGAQTGFYQQPGNSTLQSAPLHQHQTSFGLQGNVFGTHSQSHANASLQGFGSQFLSSPMPLPAAALTAQQQYRSQSLQNPNFLKGVGSQHIAEQAGRSQQLKSPGTNQQDVLASVFNSAPQIPSPKSRQNCKQPPPQSSPTQHKYVSPYQTVNNQQSAQIPPTRYPAPIQRPVNFQPALNSSLQGTGNVSSQRHRTTHNQNSRGPQQRQYYGGQGSSMQNTPIDKTDDSKLTENGTSVSISATNSSSSVINNSSTVNKSVGSATTTAASQPADLSKEASNKDEPIASKE